MELVQQALASGFFRQQDSAVIIHDLDRLEEQLRAVQTAFPPKTLHAVAVKANPLPPVLAFLAGLGAGAEAASLPELHLALAAGLPTERLVFDSPAKTMEELRFAVAKGVHVNADNLDEVARLAAIVAETGASFSAGLRVNPQVGLGRIAATSVAGSFSKFGVPLERAEAIKAAFAAHPWLSGLHVHVGSQGCPLDLLVAGVGAVYDLARAINRDLGPGRVRLFDLGGGLPAAYRDEDRPPTPQQYAAALKLRCPELFSGAYRLVTEFGRFLHAPCGLAASRVEYVKVQPGHKTAVIHLGADLFVRECYNRKSWFHRVALLDGQGRPKSGPTAIWHLAGPLCFSGDFPVWRTRLPWIKPGDIVVIRDVGAYTLSMWSRYNSRQMPRVLGVREGQWSVVREREEARDVVRFWLGSGCP